MYNFLLGEALENSTEPDSVLCRVNGVEVKGNRRVLTLAENQTKRLDKDDVTVLYAIAAGATAEVGLGPVDTILDFADLSEQIREIASELSILIERRNELEWEECDAA